MNPAKKSVIKLINRIAVLRAPHRAALLTSEEALELNESQLLLDTLEEDIARYQKSLKFEVHSKTFDTADELWIVRVLGAKLNIVHWTLNFDETITPSVEFASTFTDQVMNLKKDSARQFALDVINIFTSDLCKLPEFGRLSQIVPLKISAESKHRRPLTLSGSIHSSLECGYTPLTVNLMGAEFMDDTDLRKCIAGTAALFKILVNEGTSTRGAWGVLTDGSDWRFIQVDDGRRTQDEEGMDRFVNVRCSETVTLDLAVYDHEKVSFIYRALYRVMRRSLNVCIAFENSNEP